VEFPKDKRGKTMEVIRGIIINADEYKEGFISEEKIVEAWINQSDLKDFVDKKKVWHKGECRSYPDCSICLFLKDLENEVTGRASSQD
jgi:hypothetical protein